MDSSQKITQQKLIKRIRNYDTKGKDNEFRKIIESTLIKAVDKNEPINLISFTCSTINSKYLFSKTPWLYVSTDPQDNNLTPDITRLSRIMGELKKIYPQIQLSILIGNTDPYYIYLQQFKNFSPRQKKALWKKFNIRWEKYRKLLTKWLCKIIPSIRVISWYRFEKDIETDTGRSFENEYEEVRKNVYSYFNKDQLEWEFKKLKTQFGKGNYFENFKKPNNKILKDWVIRKFTEYTVQAKWIYENIPNAILMQNEKPSDLRSQMYQPLIKKEYQTFLPAVYFFGVDNSGYQ